VRRDGRRRKINILKVAHAFFAVVLFDPPPPPQVILHRQKNKELERSRRFFKLRGEMGKNKEDDRKNSMMFMIC
jgi:hypothetical protein